MLQVAGKKCLGGLGTAFPLSDEFSAGFNCFLEARFVRDFYVRDEVILV